MTTKTPPRRNGIAGALLFVCWTVCAAGAWVDLNTPRAEIFWLGARPGAALAMGAGVALAALVCAYAARLLRAPTIDEKDADAGADA